MPTPSVAEMERAPRTLLGNYSIHPRGERLHGWILAHDENKEACWNSQRAIPRESSTLQLIPIKWRYQPQAHLLPLPVNLQT